MLRCARLFFPFFFFQFIVRNWHTSGLLHKMPENPVQQTDYIYKNSALHPSAPARQHCIWIFALLRYVVVFNGLPCIWPVKLCPWNVFYLVPFFLRTNVSLESYLSTCNEYNCAVMQWRVVSLGTLCVSRTWGSVFYFCLQYCSLPAFHSHCA